MSNSYTHTPGVLFGCYFGWLYLRYFKWNPDVQLRGDMRTAFSFASFFPSKLQPPISGVANFMYNTSSYLGLCKQAEKHTTLPTSSKDAGRNGPGARTMGSVSSFRSSGSMPEKFVMPFNNSDPAAERRRYVFITMLCVCLSVILLFYLFLFFCELLCVCVGERSGKYGLLHQLFPRHPCDAPVSSNPQPLLLP